MTGKITGALREQSDWEQQDENRLGFIKNKPKNIATVNDINEVLVTSKAYTDSQRLGFTEQNKIILNINDSWDAHPLDRDIIGLKVTDEHYDRRFLATELDRPDASVYTDSEHLYDIGGDLPFNIRYSTFEGLLSKRCLVVGNKGLHFQCPAFFNVPTINEGLMYVFDETSDTMGLGITLKRGWYKVDRATFVCEPVDLEKTPCFFFVDKEFNSEAAKAYLYEYSTPAKTSYTVKPENIYMFGDTSFICSTDVSGIDPNSADGGKLAACWCSFRFYDGFVTAALPYPEVENVNVVIEYETIHTIDTKYLPNKDDLYLNLADYAEFETIKDELNTTIPADVAVKIIEKILSGEIVGVRLSVSKNGLEGSYHANFLQITKSSNASTGFYEVGADVIGYQGDRYFFGINNGGNLMYLFDSAYAP